MVRKRARQRLIGSAVLVLIGVIGFPLLFETQPRPVPVDIAIEIPSRTALKPGSPIAPVGRSDAPAEPDPAAPKAPTAAAPAPLPAQASLQEREEIVESQPAKQGAEGEAKPAAAADPRTSQAAALPKPEPRPQPKVDDGQRARALLEGAAVTPGDAQSRIVVQVGAFADPAKAREARAKLEKAGLKTYTQMADTKDGTRIRVRLGPYASMAEAEKAAAKVKSLNLPAAVLVL